LTPGRGFATPEKQGRASTTPQRQQQQVRCWDVNTLTHPGIGDPLEIADQIESGCVRNALGH